MSCDKEHLSMDKLHDELTEAFITYQYTLDNPMPVPPPSRPQMTAMYRTNAAFNCRVKSLVNGVMFLVERNLNKREEY